MSPPTASDLGATGWYRPKNSRWRLTALPRYERRPAGQLGMAFGGAATLPRCMSVGTGLFIVREIVEGYGSHHRGVVGEHRSGL